MLRRTATLLGFALGGAASLLAASPPARSLAVRALATRIPDPAQRHGVSISTWVNRGAWTRLVLQADLSEALSAVAGRRLEGVAYTHFGGFLDGQRAALLHPASPYYQAWVGAYAIFAPEGTPFGFDPEGRPQPACALQLLEADQRLVLREAGWAKDLHDPRPRVRQVGELTTEHVVAWAGSWVKVSGTGETNSSYQRGGRLASRRSRWLYGSVPVDSAEPVADFHPILCHATLWYRFDPVLRATVAKFYVFSEYVTADGRRVQAGASVKDECEALMDGIRFDAAP